MERRIIISGCSGGGKSTLLNELSKRGYTTVEEAGRRIVADALINEPGLLPWNDLAAFANRAIEVSRDDMLTHAGCDEWVFFDRSVIDAFTALRFAGADPGIDLIQPDMRYASTVFFAPPWEEIYENDDARKHDFAAGVAEAHRLEKAYLEFGYTLRHLPKVSLVERADWVERELGTQ